MARPEQWLATTVVVAATFAAAGTSQARDFSGQAYNVLPPGQSGSLQTTRNSTDQLELYDGLTPKAGAVKPADLRRYFKPAKFGLGGARPQKTERPGPRGLRILRDRFDVPHIYGRTRSAVMFGSGWVAAEDRGTLMEILRGPAAIATLDVPGLDAIRLALSQRRFDASPQTNRFIARQVTLLRTHGRKGRRVIADLNAYITGINAYYREAGIPVRRWTLNDVISMASLIGAVFGRGGGDEMRRSQFLSALQQRLGPLQGLQVWNDLRERQDPEAPVSLRASFPYGRLPAHRRGNAVVDAGSSSASLADTSVAEELPTPGIAEAIPGGRASNALLVSARRSTNRHPLFVAGPQVGYFYPEIMMEIDLHGGGTDARGATFPGAAPYVLIGRGQDFAWSATSSGSDVIDQYVETLCGGDTAYRYRGRCIRMSTFRAGVLKAGGGQPRRDVTFRKTVHGPVIGYATVGGKRVAISQKRSTLGREAINALAFADLNANRVQSARSFIEAMSQVELTFNWFYADDRDIAMFSSGRLPMRAPGVDAGLPTVGTGAYEWRGFLRTRDHPQRINPKSGVIVNWNNKPASGFAAADSNWNYGSIHRSQLLEEAISSHPKHSLTSVVAAMNTAATQDLRAAKVLRSIAGVLETGPAPSQRDARMLKLLRDWRAKGASRLDRTLDGKIDHPGAAIMDAAWPKIADAVMRPVLGPLVEPLALLIARDENARRLGSSYGEGWYGYVDKDLRGVRRRQVKGPFRTRFCGLGQLAACRASLWAAIDSAGAELAKAQGPRPDRWRADATKERIVFEPGILGPKGTMRWTNRPTFQQAIYFRAHRQ